MNEQLELPTHRADPETSREAARRAQPNAAAHRARILLHLYEKGSEGATAWELYLATGGARPSGAGTRVGGAEMASADWCARNGYEGPLTEDSGKKRPTDTGSPAVVWQLTERGRSYVEALGETRVA